MFGQISRCLTFMSILLAFACLPSYALSATDESSAYNSFSKSDPFEPINRAVFAFNEQADRFLLKPVAKTYRFITPDPIERSLLRAFDNLTGVVSVANDLLQGKVGQAANDSGRFLVNSTLGIAGFFDVASHVGLLKNDSEDFGQTLGAWGVKSGPYLVLPLLGSSTFRDGPAKLVDGFVNPINTVDHVPTRNSIYGTDLVTLRASFLEVEALLSGDKYAFTRDVYLQRRDYLINDGEQEDDFGDDSYGESDDDYDDF